ncbi:hypothetical protein DPX39_110123900 [Trypanosoma brucei equiperdum]|uniref:Uncharacterized protein n=1 Tax=Trypanosoma brucei equiperdum TaxID=630700 RepID=A0A3L6KUW4_9TRYP|nr:hypothetical protein DPX39_110123900 [Trypanosoma brucei equiperdum]
MDTAYATLFSKYREAAVLACDEIGIEPEDLLYRAKKSFKQSDNDSSSAILVRYTLNERTRQNRIRQVLVIRNKLVLQGNVSDKWKKRCQQYPDAPRAPRIPKAVLEKLLAQLEKEREDNSDEVGSAHPSSPAFSLTGEIHKGLRLRRSLGRSGGASFVRSPSGTETFRSPMAGSPMHMSRTSPTAAAARGRRGSKVLFGRELEVKDLEVRRGGHSATAPIIKYSEECRSSPSRSRQSGRKARKHGPVPPSDPPLFPPIPRHGRSDETLAQEAENLERYRHTLSLYAVDSAALLEKFMEQTAKRGPNGSNTESNATAQDSARSKSAAQDGEVEATKKGKRSDIVCLPQRTAQERRTAVFMRLARMQLARNMDEFRKMKIYLGEMDEIGQAGTIAASIRARANINKPPTHEEYMETLRDKERQRELRLQREKKEFQRTLKLHEKKERSAKKVLEKIKSKWTNVRLEALTTKRDIALTNRKRADRRLKMKQDHYCVRLSKKEMEAEERRRKLFRTISMKRYEHDQEELFRKNIKGKIMEMDRLKNWRSESLALPDVSPHSEKKKTILCPL